MVILKEDFISSFISCSDGVGTKLSHCGSEDWGFVRSFSEFSESSFFFTTITTTTITIIMIKVPINKEYLSIFFLL